MATVRADGRIARDLDETPVEIIKRHCDYAWRQAKKHIPNINSGYRFIYAREYVMRELECDTLGYELTMKYVNYFLINKSN